MGEAPRESVSWSAHGHLRQECYAVGGGDQATDQTPMTRRAYAAQSVVTAGLRAHTRETASPFPWGIGGLPEVDLVQCPDPCFLTPLESLVQQQGKAHLPTLKMPFV